MKLFQKSRSDKHFPVLKIVLIYAFFGTCWIYSSDTILGWLVRDPVTITRIAVLKGVFFILSTSVLLYFLVSAYTDRLTKAATRSRQAEDQLAITDQSLRAILQASPIGIGRTRGRVLEWVNEAFCRITGYGLEEIQGRGSRILYENDAEFERVGNVLYGEGVVETKWVRKDGEIRSVSVQAIQTSSFAFVFTAMDMTEHVNLESQVRQTQKMEAIGNLAGGIAHDFNNILTVISGFGSLLQMSISEDDPKKAYIDQVLVASEKAAQLTRGLLAFSRKQQLSLVPVSVNEVIKNTSKLLKSLLTDDIELRLDLSDVNPVIRADVSQVDQILFNLAANARDAMPQGGVFAIRTKVVKMEHESIGLEANGQSGEYILLHVSDTGSGMDEATKARIFDPFFTTKAVGKGTGLGLSTVYGIVKQHGGCISVVSELTRGTTFSLYFPVRDGIALKGEAESPSEVKGGTEIILVAEDNGGVRILITQILKENGYTIVEAVDGREAVAKFRENPLIDLLIFDSVMPEKNGREAYDEICAIKPNAKIIFMSGYTRDVFSDKGMDEAKFIFVAKPVQPDALLTTVRNVLDGLGKT